MNPDNARKESYDAVTLRYGIQKGTLLNIISEQKCSQNVNESEFRQNALALIEELKIVNNELEASKNKNERLIALLAECL